MDYKYFKTISMGKGSASPTLLIFNAKEDKFYKIWSFYRLDHKRQQETGSARPENMYHRDPLPYDSLQYESDLYGTKINTLLNDNIDKKLPFLGTSSQGSITLKAFSNAYFTFGTGKKHIHLKRVLRYSIILYMFNIPLTKRNVAKIMEDDDENRTMLNSHLDVPIGFLETQNIRHITYSDVLTSGSTVENIRVLKEIVRGLYYLNTKDVTHNDLHPGNIMIQNETNNVLIFDWDRAYTKDLGDNPGLDRSRCYDEYATPFKPKKCYFSQCNKFTKGYSTDLFFVLASLIISRNLHEDTKTILASVFGITNSDDLRFVIQKLGNPATRRFNSVDEKTGLLCSYLHFPDTDVDMNRVISVFGGDIKTIYAKTLESRYVKHYSKKELEVKYRAIVIGFTLIIIAKLLMSVSPGELFNSLTDAVAPMSRLFGGDFKTPSMDVSMSAGGETKNETDMKKAMETIMKGVSDDKTKKKTEKKTAMKKAMKKDMDNIMGTAMKDIMSGDDDEKAGDDNSDDKKGGDKVVKEYETIHNDSLKSLITEGLKLITPGKDGVDAALNITDDDSVGRFYNMLKYLKTKPISLVKDAEFKRVGQIINEYETETKTKTEKTLEDIHSLNSELYELIGIKKPIVLKGEQYKTVSSGKKPQTRTMADALSDRQENDRHEKEEVPDTWW